MEENLLMIHGGGPIAVINASLYGVVKEAKTYQICAFQWWKRDNGYLWKALQAMPEKGSRYTRDWDSKNNRQ